MTGLYLVIAGQAVLYVGQAKNIRQRWLKGHHKGLNLGRYYDAARIASVGCSEHELNASERMFIAWFNCPLNATISQSDRAKLRCRLEGRELPEAEDKSASKLDRLINLLSGFHVEGNAPYEIKEALQIAIELRDDATVKEPPPVKTVEPIGLSARKGRDFDLLENSLEFRGDMSSAPTGLSTIAFKDTEAEFHLFWDAVKKKVGKENARKAFKRVRDVDVQTLIEKLQYQQDWHMKRNGSLTFFAQPTNWLYGRRWEDDYDAL